MIPHDWNNTSVISILPKWAREGGTDATLDAAARPAVRQKVKDNPAPMLLIVKAAAMGPRSCCSTPRVNRRLVGLRLSPRSAACVGSTLTTR